MNGNFTQNAINPMNALLYFENQQLQAWHECLGMIFNIVVRFNIQFLIKQKEIENTLQVWSML